MQALQKVMHCNNLQFISFLVSHVPPVLSKSSAFSPNSQSVIPDKVKAESEQRRIFRCDHTLALFAKQKAANWLRILVVLRKVVLAMGKALSDTNSYFLSLLCPCVKKKYYGDSRHLVQCNRLGN